MLLYFSKETEPVFTVCSNILNKIGKPQGPKLMNFNCLPPPQIWITDLNPYWIFNFESVVQIWTGSGELSDIAQIH